MAGGLGIVFLLFICVIQAAIASEFNTSSDVISANAFGREVVSRSIRQSQICF